MNIIETLESHIAGITRVPWADLLVSTVNVAGVSIPLWGVAVAIVGVALCLPVTTRKTRRSWRVGASRRWLKRFRKHAHRFHDHQRFAFIRATDHFLFEDILMSAFEERGYQVRRTPATGDGGSDGYLNLDGLQVVVQAKRYHGPIARRHVMALELLADRNPKLHKGLFIHTGKTSRPIKAYVDQSPTLAMISGVSDILTLLDGHPLTLFGKPLRPAKKRVIRQRLAKARQQQATA